MNNSNFIIKMTFSQNLTWDYWYLCFNKKKSTFKLPTNICMSLIRDYNLMATYVLLIRIWFGIFV